MKEKFIAIHEGFHAIAETPEMTYEKLQNVLQNEGWDNAPIGEIEMYRVVQTGKAKIVIDWSGV
jgi:hypothetical protein